jgi:hypothetical protein
MASSGFVDEGGNQKKKGKNKQWSKRYLGE